MKRTLLFSISIAAVTVACGGSHKSDVASTASTAPASTATAPADAAPSSQTADTKQTVTLIGCLAGPPRSTTVGTTGSRAQARATGPDSLASQAADSSTGIFGLMNASPESPAAAGSGNNGAGGSGGPVVGPKATYELDGVPDSARDDVDKQVRIVGSVDARPITSPQEVRKLSVQSVDVVAESCAQ